MRPRSTDWTKVKKMRIIILIVLVISSLTAVACTSEVPSPADTQTASRPTADVPATVAAGIRGTREAETAIDATVEAKVAETLATSAPTPMQPAGSFVSVSAGVNHTCGVKSDSSAACWGNNDYGGQATPPTGSFVSVSAGDSHTCGVKSDGSVACWGRYEYGQATPPAGSFDSVSAGVAHTCGVRSNGSVACWGSDGAGQATPPDRGRVEAIGTAAPGARQGDGHDRSTGTAQVAARVVGGAGGGGCCVCVTLHASDPNRDSIGSLRDRR